MNEIIKSKLKESIETKQRILNDSNILDMINKVSIMIAETISNGGKLVLCGNGGSASDALHFAGEIVGRFKKERKAWPAIVLNSDVATMTAIANDYGYDEVFSRQVEGQVTAKDIVIGFSTSGNSENIYKAILKSKEIGAKSVGMLGNNGGKICDVVDYPIVIPYNVTARIQECHITIVHIICEIVENILTNC